MSQTRVNYPEGLTFETGLRSILRQDPDIVMVGEVRDLDTARMAIQSALTGHLCLQHAARQRFGLGGDTTCLKRGASAV